MPSLCCPVCGEPTVLRLRRLCQLWSSGQQGWHGFYKAIGCCASQREPPVKVCNARSVGSRAENEVHQVQFLVDDSCI